MAKPNTHKSAAKPKDEHAAMLKTAAAIVACMHKDVEDPRFLPLVKYLDIKPFSNMVALLLNSPQSALVHDLPEKWVQLFAANQQEELAALSVPPEEDEEEDKEEKQFNAMLSGFLMSLVSLASPLGKLEKAKAEAKEMMLAKAVMPHLDEGTMQMPLVTRACRRPSKADSQCRVDD
ncbi:hypothetical protein DACRYDRAFT_106754 [Dacryopinax primogenitus]|uniref:Uncharacterized protein n=1 Tax=Dacryopinax primogenitus (strain DJM 731) TaxID=1858805 RepID=M5G3A0_DACPD|nr:uncharacterized protein DACRYDRAFT_106754 [Dacryopinax primogenitus]EJU02690.1 hypothetical protein DACRYDRAFT_106754 [Dacryopinax primogenitus]